MVMASDRQDIPKRHHFVSQMQLARFTDETGRLYSFNKRAGRILYGSPKNAFVERHLYSIENEDGSKDTRLEVAFSGLEGRANQIIDKIISAVRAGFAPRLTPSEKADWDLFFFMQWRRVPDMHQKVISRAEADANLDEVFDSLRDEVPDRIDEINELDTPATRRRLMQSSKVGAIASVSPEVMGNLARRGLAVMKVYAPGEKFVIGSLPIVRFGGTLDAESTEAWLPITPDIIAGIGAFGSGVRLSPIFDPQVVRKVNRATASQSTIFAGPSRAEVEELRDSLKEPD